MKNLFIALSLLMSGVALAESFNISASADGENISINFRTIETHSSMCTMSVTALNMTAKSIEIKASTNPNAACMAAFGPHRGALTLQRGSSLPRLSRGEYKLKINGETYPNLIVTASKAVMAEENNRVIQLEGTLQSGVAAIGGETTGTMLIASDTTTEIALPSDLAFYGRHYNGRKVKIRGLLTQVTGVEIPTRLVLEVISLELAN